MTTTGIYWKDKIDDLRGLAMDVMAAPASHEKISARAAARCFHGIVSHVSRKFGQDTMQRACAELVRHADAWSSSFARLPDNGTGFVAEPVMLLAVVARGLLEVAGPAHLRAALSFWATEDDPVAWSRVLAA